MKKLQFSGLLLLLGLMLGVVVACGGETATPTPVPTATPVPPTNTPVPTVPPATNTPSAQPASSADVTLISDAITNTKNLKSYHAVISASGEVITQPVRLEGDFVAPDKAYVKGTAGGQQIEQLATGGKSYTKDASGKWTVQSASTGTGVNVNPVDLSGENANILSSLAPLLAGGTQYMNLGQETLDGTTTQHFSGQVDAAGLMGGGASTGGAPAMSLGTVQFWIDPSNKVIRKVTMDLDLAPFIKLMVGAFAGLAGTPGPGTPTATPIPDTMKLSMSVIISKPNDPSITIPAPPADAVPAPTDTAAPGLETAVPAGTGASGSGTSDTTETPTP